MKVGICVEGGSDQDSLPFLVHSLTGSSLGIEKRRVPAGDMLSDDKMEGILIPLIRQHPDISKVLIFRDCECAEPKEIQQFHERMRRIEKELRDRIRRRIRGVEISYILVIHALEAWLMADGQAVREVLGNDVADRLPANPEHECRPRQLLEWLSDLFDHMKHDKELAKRARPEIIKVKCPSFQKLEQALRDC